MSEWRDDLKKVMLGAGLNNTQSVFLFSDTQVIMKINENELMSYYMNKMK
jgi:hypothetical protein